MLFFAAGHWGVLGHGFENKILLLIAPIQNNIVGNFGPLDLRVLCQTVIATTITQIAQKQQKKYGIVKVRRATVIGDAILP